MDKKLLLTFVLCLTAISGWAQGDNVGMGGRDEGVASILEKLNVMQKKNEAFNIFLNTNMAYEEYLGHDEQGGFKGRQMRFEARGFLDEHWSYRLRYSLNKTWQQQSDGFANSLDIMMVNYQINPRLRITGGKRAISMGGFEYDANAIQVLEYSDFNNYLSTSLIGVELSYDIGHRQLIQLDISNTNNNSLDKAYPGAGLEKSRHPLSLTLNWIGSRLWDKLENHWSYSYMHEAKGVSNRLLMMGSRLTIGKWICYLDYYRAWEDIDRHGIVSADAAAAGLTQPVGDDGSAPATLRDVRYQSLVGRCLYQITPHWACFVKGFAERASAPDVPELKDYYRHNYGYQAAVQWIPDLTQDARLSLAYVGKTTTFKDACGLPDQHSNRVELSLIYRIKIF
jgi:hypothetical protein